MKERARGASKCLEASTTPSPENRALPAGNPSASHAVSAEYHNDEYLTLLQLSAYSKVSVRQLRNYLALPPGQALPCYRPGRKLLVRREEFDAWFAQFKTRGHPALIRNLRALGFDAESLHALSLADDAAFRL